VINQSMIDKNLQPSLHNYFSKTAG